MRGAHMMAWVSVGRAHAWVVGFGVLGRFVGRQGSHVRAWCHNGIGLGLYWCSQTNSSRGIAFILGMCTDTVK